MKKITITSLSLLLILTSLFSTPISVLANTEAEPEDGNIEVETTEEAEAEDSNTEEAEPPGDEESGTEPEEAATDEEVTEETSEETTEDEAVSEQNSEETTEEAPEEEEIDEERHGFYLEIAEALNADGNHFTEEEGLDSEEAFTLRLESKLDADQNYQTDDVETVQLPASVVVAEAEQGTVNSNGKDIATYTIHTNGKVEFTFLEAVESAGAVDELVDVSVYINENSVDEEFAYITPIEAEEQVVIPLFVEEEVVEEAAEESEESVEEDEAAEEESEESTEEDETTEEESEESTEEDETAEEKFEESKEEDEEKQGFSLAIEEALNEDGEVFTEEEGLDPEETLTLRVQSNLEENQNYQADDVEVVELPSSVEVAEATQGTLESDGTEIATYNVSEDGITEFTFLESVESVGAANSTVEVEVYVNEDSMDEEFAYIDPIDEEEQLVVPLAVEEEIAEIAPLAELTQNIFEFRSLTHNGEEIEDGATIDLSDGTQVELVFDWHTEGLNAQSGDTATIQLPDAFDQITTPATPLVTSGITVGTYQIQNGELQIIFNDNIEEGDVSNGEIGLNLDFNLQKFEENIEQVINFNDTTGKELNVIARPNNLASGITKEGHPDQAHNASEITWTIDVMNNSSEAVTTATLADILPEGLGEPEDFVITELSTNLSGDKVTGETVDDVTPIPNDSGFELAFDNLEPYQGYRVQYTTPITDRTLTEFTNDATFHDGESDLPAEATVSGLTASNPIEKSGSYNEETGQIDWTIVANENGSAIENTIIDDILPEGLSVDEEKFAVEKFVDGVSDGNVTIETNNFPVNLGPTAANEHYEINFSTNIDYGSDYQTENDFENVATLNNGEEEIGRDEAVVEFDRQPLLEKGVTSGGIDYDNKKISWTVDLNRAQHELNGVIVTDTLPEGLTLTADDIIITNSDGETVEANVTIAQGVTDSEGGDITFDFGDISTQHITIKYNTEITSFDVDSFANTVGLVGDGIGEEEHTTTIPASPPANSFEKNHTAIDYNEKTMDWNLTVNPIREGIESLVIEDTFPNKGMILLPDTVTVKHSANDELTLGTDYTLEPRTEDGETGYQKGFIINLIGDYATLDGGTLEVEYQTSYDPQLEVEGNTLDAHPDEDGQAQIYLNNAHFTGTTTSGHDVDADRGASTTVREDSWNSGYKEGQLVHEDSEGNIVNGWQGGTERKIAWQLYTNYQQQDLGSDVVITDTLQYEGSIEEDSIRVSTYTVAANGDTSITEEVLDPGAYSVNVDGDTFTLTFNQEVSERYAVEFLTTVPNTSEENYTNEATVSVDGNDSPYSGTVSYENYDNFLDKSSVGQEGSDVYIGDEVNWEVQVNDSLSIIDNAEITDILSAGLEYVQGTLEITTLDGNALSEGEDYVLSNTKTEDDRTRLNIELNESLNQILVLNYTTVVTAEDGATVNNEVTLSGDNIENRTVTTEELTAEQFSWASGDFNPNRGALQIVKSDSASGDAIADNPAIFELYYDLNGERVQFGEQLQTDDNGEILIGNLPLRTYYLVEVEAPTGYVIDETEQVIEITEPYGTGEGTYETEFTNTKEKTDVSVTKEWLDEENQDGLRPGSIEVQLLADGEASESIVTLSENNEWTNTWTDLDEYKSNGELINYTVEEVNVPDGYESETNSDDDNNITITNTHVPEVTEVTVSKSWDDADNQDGVRPNNVTVNLLNGSEIETSAVLNEDNNWQHTFDDLPKFANGEEIQYSVTENVVADYSTEIDTTETDTGLNSVVTNTYTPEETTATVTKFWNDGDNQDGNRPETVTVQLLADREPEGEPVTLTASDNWTYTWEGLDLNASGSSIEYTVEEIEAPEGYEVNINNEDHGNLMITNTYEPEMTEIPVNKVWDDENDQDGVRPDNIRVNLLADGEILKPAVLDADENGDWGHTFTELPVNDDGEPINYTVTENAVEDYSTSIQETGEGFTVTNTHTPGQTSATVTKDWDDENNQDGNRPASIEVQLTANGEPEGEPMTLSTTNDWTYTWLELDTHADGEEINYSVEELNTPEEYEVSINDNDHGNMIITNSYTPAEIEVPVSKVWDDEENQDDIRPNNITVNLIADDGGIVTTAILDEENDWQYTFTELPQFDDGEEISYRVTENSVSEYSTSISQNEEEEFVITNSYTPEETSVTVTKGWDDASDQDGARPESIEVQLLQEGEPVGDVVEITAEENWTYTWQGLDVNADGEAIDYSVEEVNVPEGYSVGVNDTDHGNIILTNSYTPAETEIPVEKIWDDSDDQDRVRPGEVIVNLNDHKGELAARVLLNEDNDWQHTFTDLPEYANGETINYTVTENAVNDYSTSIEENEDGVQVITNSYTPEETSVTVTKGWDDGNNQDGNRPESIEVQLYANGEPEGEAVELTSEDDWTYTWQGLALNEEGEAIEYSVEELNVPEEYEAAYNNEDRGNIIISNSYSTQVTEISGTKTWNDADNQDGKRPESITVNLLADGEEVDSRTVTEAEDWTYTFTDLPVFEEGNEIEYTIEEVSVEEYETEINGFDITNSYTPETTEVTGTKTWNDEENQDGNRPASITVNLLANGNQADSVEVTEEDEWNYSFTDLPVYEAGEVITYTVTEDTVADYSYEQTGEEFDITNNYTPEETSVTVTKGWNDGSNQDGKRPETIEVQLTGDGEAIEEPVTLSEENDWMNTWNGLDLNADGEAIHYSVEELNVPEGYTSNINDSNHGNIIVTNSYTPEMIEIPVVKVWDDLGNQDGERPSQIELNLLNDRGEIVRTAVVSDQEGDQWQYTFSEIPKYENGSEINYTVTEDFVSDYSTSIEQNENGDPIIINSYTPEETSVTVTKGWDDFNDQDGNRPESIEVQLTADGEETGESFTLSEENNWTNTWTGLDVNTDGEAIDYSVEELNVPEGYTSSINDENHGNIIITNSYTPETVDIPVMKVWDDSDNQDEVRPDNITANLLNDEGKVIEQAILSEDNDWNYTFADLPKFAEGEEINYSVTENSVANYSASIESDDDGFVITNSHTPEETSATVTKGWKDKKDKYDSRPDSIEVQLLADGEIHGDSVTLSDDNNWTHTWNGLAVNDNGEPITYSVEELDIPEGYKSIVKDKDHGNIIVINDYTPEDPETPGTEDPGTPETEDGEDPPTDSPDKETPGTDEKDDKPTDSSDEGTPSTEEDETPTGSTDEGTPETEEGEGTPGSGEDEGSDTSLPLTGVALGSTIAIIATVLLAIGAALLFFARRRNN